MAETSEQKYNRIMTEIATKVSAKSGVNLPMNIADIDSAIDGIEAVITITSESDLPTTASDGTVVFVND